MPIGSGGAGGGGSLALISSTTLGADGTFDVAAIPATYNDLLLAIVARGTRAAATDNILLRFNNDSAAANYEGEILQGSLASASAATFNAASHAGCVLTQTCPAASAAANKFGVLEVWVHGYASTTWLKNVLSLSWGNYSSAGGRDVDYCGSQWSSTAAINRVQVLGDTTTNLLAGSTLRIYGRS